MSRIVGSGSAAAHKIDAADRGSRGSLQQKVFLIAEFITARAKNGNFMAVRCPSQREWKRIASHGARQLPTEAALRIFADDPIHEAAQRKGGSYEQAYFDRAKQLLKSRNER